MERAALPSLAFTLNAIVLLIMAAASVSLYWNLAQERQMSQGLREENQSLEASLQRVLQDPSAEKVMVERVKRSLADGKPVQIIGFGTFDVRVRSARVGFNPRDRSKKIVIPARKLPAFKAGRCLKDIVDAEDYDACDWESRRLQRSS